MQINKTILAKKYWKKNIQYLTILLSIWAMVSFGAGIVFKSNRDSENQEVYNKIEALRKAIQIAEKI